jgi:lysophospholipase L1-like esterase
MLLPTHLPRPISSPFSLVFRLANLFICVVMLALLLAGCGFGSSPKPSGNGSSALATPTQRAAYIYVAIGASETFGTGADRPATQNWPIDLSVHLPQGTQVVNLGIPGITAPQALQSEVPEAIDASPNLVTVWLGTNDIVNMVTLADYQQSLDSILTELASISHARIAVANIPDLNLLPRFYSFDQAALQAQVEQWNKVVAQEVKSHGDLLVDVYSESSDLLGHPEYLSGDGLHPSTLGYRQIANYFYEVLKANGVI